MSASVRQSVVRTPPNRRDGHLAASPDHAARRPTAKDAARTARIGRTWGACTVAAMPGGQGCCLAQAARFHGPQGFWCRAAARILSFARSYKHADPRTAQSVFHTRPAFQGGAAHHASCQCVTGTTSMHRAADVFAACTFFNGVLTLHVPAELCKTARAAT